MTAPPSTETPRHTSSGGDRLPIERIIERAICDFCRKSPGFPDLSLTAMAKDIADAVGGAQTGELVAWMNSEHIDAYRAGKRDGVAWAAPEKSDFYNVALYTAPPSGDAAQRQPDRGALAQIAAECHRAKWEFDLSEDFKPNARSARALILTAFRQLHRIGDLALKLRDSAVTPSPGPGDVAIPDYDSAARALGFRQISEGGKWWVPDPLWHPSYLGRWDTAEDIFKSWGPSLPSTHSQSLQNRDEMLRGLAEFFSESVHLVWSNDEIADCLTGMIGDGSQVTSTDLGSGK